MNACTITVRRDDLFYPGDRNYDFREEIRSLGMQAIPVDPFAHYGERNWISSIVFPVGPDTLAIIGETANQYGMDVDQRPVEAPEYIHGVGWTSEGRIWKNA